MATSKIKSSVHKRYRYIWNNPAPEISSKGAYYCEIDLSGVIPEDENIVGVSLANFSSLSRPVSIYGTNRKIGILTSGSLAANARLYVDIWTEQNA